MKSTLLILMTLLPFLGQAAVLGTDNRLNLEELSKRNPLTLAKATATQINLKYLDSKGLYPTGKLQNLCPGERYAKTPILGGCSGFLIAPDILATAGHCFDYSKGCENDAWLFHHFKSPDYPKHSLPKEHLYKCVEVLEFKHDMIADYALLKLDRPVPGVKPLELAKMNEAIIDDPVAVLGYPLGLPFTYTGGGRVVGVDQENLRVDSDAWKNNSGSALFNLRTGKVEGILTNSKRGLSFSKQDGCRLSINHSQNDHVTLVNRLQRIPSIETKLEKEYQERGLVFENQTSLAVHLSLKLRSRANNDWETLNFIIPPGKVSKRFFSMDNLFYVFAESEERKLIRGQDFYGFPYSPQGSELSYKKMIGQKEVYILK
jgi:V8-like Glu-specific endopeptidase